MRYVRREVNIAASDCGCMGCDNRMMNMKMRETMLDPSDLLVMSLWMNFFFLICGWNVNNGSVGLNDLYRRVYLRKSLVKTLQD